MRILKKNKAKLYIGIGIGVVMILFFTMPIFRVQIIEVTNNRYYSKSEIIKTSGIQKGQHILDLNASVAKSNLKQLPYIAQVHINRKFPNKVTINIVEKAPYVYVKFKGNYLCLNEQGQVIEQSQEKYHDVPIIDGLRFERFKIGETLPILNQDNWFILQEIMEILQKYEYIPKVKEIDISNIEQIHLYVDKLDVIMGDIGEFNKKIEVLIQTYEVKGYSVGELDISTWPKTGSATLRPIT